MIFFVCKKGYIPNTNMADRAYLIEDHWNDWFTYVTMFSFIYVDSSREIHHVGSVKIGEFNMAEGQSSPNLPQKFEQLDTNFFSVGQSDDYYNNLNGLGEEVRINVLKSLNDIALDADLYEKAIKEDVTTSSLLRDVSSTTVTRQFRRMATGGARLTRYDFTFTTPVDEKNLSGPTQLTFEVIPESNPPTNIHVIIGRNGVGKTFLIKNMIQSLLENDNQDNNTGVFTSNTSASRRLLSNIVCVAFSAFDEFPITKDNDNSIPYIFIGLEQNISQTEGQKIQTRLRLLTKQFVMSLRICLRNRSKNALWKKAVTILESDPMFKEADAKSLVLCENEPDLTRTAIRLFKRLSSGHKIILLTITRLVETVEECTLVLLDEPETHLHPPLLAAFIRALSDLLINRNGVAIITTHSPVILQETPRSCVWKLRRIGREVIVERPDMESFGENISLLTSEIFGLEVTYSGFHNMLFEAVKKHGTNYRKILNQFDNELGMEAKAILKTLIATYQEDTNEED